MLKILTYYQTVLTLTVYFKPMIYFLISNSAEGLQQSLDRLSKYCQDWLLKINPTKTKVIVFQKKSRKSAIDKHNFMVSNENIEIVNNYTYLGVKFSANGNFTNHKENLTEKTKRSFFAARRYLDFLKLINNSLRKYKGN